MKTCPRCGSKKWWHLSTGQSRCSNCGLTRKMSKNLWKKTRISPSQQEEIKIETENRLPEFWKEKLNKVRGKGIPSKLLEVVLEEKRREIIKEWIKYGRIKERSKILK